MHVREGHATAETAIDAKVRVLSSPEAYAHRPERVDIVQTHMSWIFLAGEQVYKLKKPVTSEYFDFTSLAAREFNSHNELKLNKRLAGDVYQGVARLTLESDGRLVLDGAGDTIDWLVVMRRLPSECMLDRLIERSALDPRQLEQLGERLAVFYAAQPAAAIEPEAYVDRFMRELATNRSVFLAAGADTAFHQQLLDRLGAALVERTHDLKERVRSGCIVDGHGDLRPEHVCMTEPIIIFDCLEFSDELRLVDPVDELAFLGMECAMLGASWVGPRLAEHVLKRLGERASDDLTAVYTACRAALRARHSLSHLLDPVPRDPEKWRPLADRYASAADAALRRLAV